MNAPLSLSPSRAMFWLGAAALTGLALVGLYRPVLGPLLERPFQGEQFGLGAFAVAISVWLVWQRRSVLASCKVRPSPAGLGLLALGIAAYAFSRRMEELFPASMTLPLSVLGLIWALGGRVLARQLLVPAVFLAGAFPLPISVAGTIAFPLQNIVAALAAEVLRGLGVGVIREGIKLGIEEGWVQVADVCSGLSSFTALLWLWLLLVYLRGGGNRRRQLFLLALLLPIAIAANVVRVVIIVLILKAFGPEPAFGWFHEVLSLLIFGGTLAICFALIPAPERERLEHEDAKREHEDAKREREDAKREREDAKEDGESAEDHGTRLPPPASPFPPFRWQDGLVYAAALGLLVVAIPFSKPKPAGGELVRLDPQEIPLALGDWQGQDLEKLPEQKVGPRPPKPGEYFYRKYHRPGSPDRPLELYYVRSNRGRDAFIDIESITLNQGFLIVESRVFTLSVAGRPVQVRQLVLKNGPVWRVYVYSYFGDRRSAVSRIGYKSLIALERGLLGHYPTWSLLWVATEDLEKVGTPEKEAAAELFRQALALTPGPSPQMGRGEEYRGLK